jgi:hypothetical protein
VEKALKQQKSPPMTDQMLIIRPLRPIIKRPKITREVALRKPLIKMHRRIMKLLEILEKNKWVHYFFLKKKIIIIFRYLTLFIYFFKKPFLPPGRRLYSLKTSKQYKAAASAVIKRKLVNTILKHKIINYYTHVQ